MVMKTFRALRAFVTAATLAVGLMHAMVHEGAGQSLLIPSSGEGGGNEDVWHAFQFRRKQPQPNKRSHSPGLQNGIEGGIH